MINSEDLKIETKIKRKRMKVDVATNCDPSVRMTHIPSGITVESCEKSSQLKNAEECRRLIEEQLENIR